MLIKQHNTLLSGSKSNKTKVKISAFGLKVLKKLNHSEVQIKSKADGVRLGSLSVPKSLLTELRSMGLVEISNDGVLNLTDAGSSYIRRAVNKPRGVHVNKHIGASYSEPFQSQHRVGDVVIRRIDGKLKKLNVNLAESPLGWLRKRKDRGGECLISENQFNAAERLRIDYELATHNKQLVANYDGVPISKDRRAGPSDLSYTDIQIDAKRRFDAAISYVGPGLSDSLVRICCYLEGFVAAEKKLGWPSRSMKLVVLMALTRLVEHYEKGERPAK